MGERFRLSLVSMPWSLPHRPSIQTGLLAAVCADAAIPVRQWSFHVDWFEHMVSVLGGKPNEVFDVYAKIAEELVPDLVGEWIFAGLVNASASPADYLDYLADRRVAPQTREVVRVLAESAGRFVDECAERLLASPTTMVGLTTSHCQTMPSLALAKRLKELDHRVVTVFGGANCDKGMGRRLQQAYPAVDFVVEGEGERALVDLCRVIAEQGAPGPVGIPGVFPAASQWPGQDFVPPGVSSVVPDYSAYFDKVDSSPHAGLLRHHVQVPIEMSRGCWWGEKHHCTFCGLNGSGMPFRAKAENFLATQLDELAARHGVTNFAAVDNIIDMNLLRNGLPALASGERDYSLFFEVKANLRRDQLELARRAGVRSLQPGIESLDSGILKDIDKGVTAFQNIRFLLDCLELGIEPQWNVIINLPADTPARLANMLHLVPSLTHLPPPILSGLQVQRYSPYHATPERYGIELLGPADAYRYVFELADDDLEAVAYFFKFALPEDDPANVELRRRLVRRLNIWRKSYVPNALLARRGPGFLLISDVRVGLGPRTLLLRGAEANAFGLCFGGISRDKLVQACGPAVPEPEVRGWIDRWQADRLVYTEGQSIIALPIRETPTPRGPGVAPASPGPGRLSPTWPGSRAPATA